MPGDRVRKVAWILVLLLCLPLLGCAEGGGVTEEEGVWDATPKVMVPQASGTKVAKNDSATIDLSNAAQGYVAVTSKINSSQTKLRISFNGDDSSAYIYNLETPGKTEFFPLSLGNGKYNIAVMEHVRDSQYSIALSEEISLNLEDEFGPFLYPNQYVYFDAQSPAIALASELCQTAKGEISAVNAIYDYVISNITYDMDKAAAVQSDYGYVPDINQTLSVKSGICFDYGSLTAAMLRSQGFPTKLVIGYAGSAYHAWISVYTKSEGWIGRTIRFDGNSWVRMDPTFASSSTGNDEITAFIGDGSNYIDDTYH